MKKTVKKIKSFDGFFLFFPVFYRRSASAEAERLPCPLIAFVVEYNNCFAVLQPERHLTVGHVDRPILIRIDLRARNIDCLIILPTEERTARRIAIADIRYRFRYNKSLHGSTVVERFAADSRNFFRQNNRFQRRTVVERSNTSSFQSCRHNYTF